MSSLIKNFPADIPSWKSLLLLGVAHRFALLVGFGFVAAWNPGWLCHRCWAGTRNGADKWSGNGL